MITPSGLSCFAEPCHLVYTVPYASLSRAAKRLEALVSRTGDDQGDLVVAGIKMREHRIQHAEKAILSTVSVLNTDILNCISCIGKCTTILEAANDPGIHWKYSIGAIRFLRTLVRRDMPLSQAQMRYFMQKTYDDHPSMVCSSSCSLLSQCHVFFSAM
jgi:proteasome activator subunit 4